MLHDKMLIIYFILLLHGWEFVAVQNEDDSGYCERLKNDLDKHNHGELGNMKVICVEDREVEL